jgi:hypothetical protein
MACLYRRKRSPFWWIEYKKDGLRRLESTGLRYEDELQTAQARVILAAWRAREARERNAQGRTPISDPSFDWSWVDTWLDGHCKSPKTRSAYGLHWRHIQHWLAVSKIRHPREISFRQATSTSNGALVDAPTAKRVAGTPSSQFQPAEAYAHFRRTCVLHWPNKTAHLDGAQSVCLWEEDSPGLRLFPVTTVEVT